MQFLGELCAFGGVIPGGHPPRWYPWELGKSGPLGVPGPQALSWPAGGTLVCESAPPGGESSGGHGELGRRHVLGLRGGPGVVGPGRRTLNPGPRKPGFLPSGCTRRWWSGNVAAESLTLACPLEAGSVSVPRVSASLLWKAGGLRTAPTEHVQGRWFCPTPQVHRHRPHCPWRALPSVGSSPCCEEAQAHRSRCRSSGCRVSRALTARAPDQGAQKAPEGSSPCPVQPPS